MKRMFPSAQCLLLLCFFCKFLTAQTASNVSFPSDIHFDFLSYNYLSYKESPFHGDFQPLSTLSSIPVKVILIHPSHLPDKIYRITDYGECEFRYRDSTRSASCFHPITGRTFYLEAVRNGIIPALPYSEFVKLSVFEKQNLIIAQEPKPAPDSSNTKESFNATLSYMVTTQGLKLFVIKGRWQIELVSAGTAENVNTALIKYLPIQRKIPTMVTMLIHPWNGANLSNWVAYKKTSDVLQDAGNKSAPP